MNGGIPPHSTYRQNHIKFVASLFTNEFLPAKLIELRADIDAIQAAHDVHQ